MQGRQNQRKRDKMVKGQNEGRRRGEEPRRRETSTKKSRRLKKKERNESLPQTEGKKEEKESRGDVLVEKGMEERGKSWGYNSRHGTPAHLLG